MLDFTNRILLLSALVFAVPGCGGGSPRPAEMPQLYPCTITITQERQPLDEASVTLISDEPDLEKWAAGGFTDQKGNCIPYVRSKFKGVPVGKFKVTVSKTETEPSKMGDVPPEGLSQQEVFQWWNKREREKLKSFRLVAEKYALPTTTDLEIEVLPKSNTFSLDVGAPIRIHLLPSD